MKKLFVIILILGISLPIIYSFTEVKTNPGDNGLDTVDQISVSGEELFQKNCAVCHGTDRKGNPPAFPSLLSVYKRFDKGQVSELLQAGRNNMPSFAHLSGSERDALVGFLFGEKTETDVVTAIAPEQNGERLFIANCSRCHKARPDDPQPPDQREWGMQPMVLGGINLRHGINEFENILDTGPCYMPSFESLRTEDKKDVYAYLGTMEDVYGEANSTGWRQCGMGCGRRE
ncbi:MAG: c-type cytochrome [Chlorobi bacterium]|nr:c-type cytochrome [Chlorobiota bacterium]